MGTPEFACGILNQLLQEDIEIALVVSQPDKKVGRQQLLRATPVKELAVKNNLNVFQPDSIKTDFQPVLDANLDLIVTCAYGQFIPDEVLNAPKLGCINVHASLLPKYRGGAPIHKAIIEGESKTGITIVKMVKKMDAGDMVAKVEVPIEFTDTTEILHDKLMNAGAKLLHETLPDIFNGHALSIPQNHEEATFAWNISKEEEFIDFSWDSLKIYNTIRGLISWPVGYGILEGKIIKFHAVRYLDRKCDKPSGTVLGLMDNAFAVSLGKAILLIDVLQLEGKKKMNAIDFMNGHGKELIGKCFQKSE